MPLLTPCTALFIIAAIDIPYQQFEFIKKLKMTKKEIKDEMKDIEGQPEVRQKIRQKQRDLAQQRMLEDVPSADVVITNPQHFAVALLYEVSKDEAPKVVAKGKKKQLMIPYTLDNNDMRFATNQGFNTGDHFYTYLKDSFDALYEEGKTHPKMMSVGLHCRIIGKPGRIQALKKFLDYIKKQKNVWICKRVDIAKHWIKNYSK